ncbi:carboxypeptidase-like regulatory domain-containing protein [Lactiplantibacillus plantarum]|uniref:carboxypeptidase-like regulatory domain-containing protein n=1 Tax=Lactiplantibacillus plantarum TaxID=1590 RepID=UPI002659D283|nr:carboxypeptidase-like regulatory domain-containing protein [Lactiplantibacillus plantarum]WKF80347.1 carboxypeptidase-like regulatory domain-containing protein [Lactiplantibacillus plantarum]
MRKFIVTISLLALTFLVSGCINQSTTKIKLNKTTFTPAETIRGKATPGSTITFKNKRDKVTTKTNDDGRFFEGDLNTGKYDVTASFAGKKSKTTTIHVKESDSLDAYGESEDFSKWESENKEDDSDYSSSTSDSSETASESESESRYASSVDESTFSSSSNGISDIAIEDTIKQHVSDVKVKEISGEYHKPVTTGIDINVKDSSDYYDEGAYKKDAYHILLAIKDDYGFSDFKNITITFYMDGDALVKSSFDQSALKQINHKDSNYYNIDSVATEWNADNLNAKYDQ